MSAMMTMLDEDEKESTPLKRAKEMLKQWKREVQCAVNLAELLDPFASDLISDQDLTMNIENMAKVR